MKKRVSAKILRLSIFVFFCSQNSLISESAIENDNPSRLFWDITQENQHLTKKPLRDALEETKNMPPPTFTDLSEGEKDEDWDNYFRGDETDEPLDISIKHDTDNLLQRPPKLKTNRPDTSFVQNPNKSDDIPITTDAPVTTADSASKNPELFFPLAHEQSEDFFTPSAKQVIQQSIGKDSDHVFPDLADNNKDTWPTPFFERQLESISTRQENAPLPVLAPLSSLDDPHEIREDLPVPSIGQIRVTTDPYVHFPLDSSERKILIRKKNPYIQFQHQKEKALETSSAFPSPSLQESVEETLIASPSFRSEEIREVLTRKKRPFIQPLSSGKKAGILSPNASSLNAKKILAQLDQGGQQTIQREERKTPPKTILINFNNVSIIEYIRFISRLTNKNFVFDENDLQFNVTIISEEPTTLENVITALIQELRIHGLSLIEEDDNFIIHRNEDVRSISRVNVGDTPSVSPRESEIVTQVFTLNTLEPNKASEIISPLLSTQALIETDPDTMHIIVTDIVTNIEQVGILLKNLDAPNSGLVIGQYVVRSSFMDTLIQLAKQIMEPIAKGQTLTFVPHPEANSIFVVSSPFLVERTLSVLHHLDYFRGTTRIYDLEDLKLERIAPIVSPPGAASLTPTIPSEGEEERPTEEPVGKWELNPQGNWLFRPSTPKATTSEEAPRGRWMLDPQRNWHFVPEGTNPPLRLQEPGALEELERGATPKGQWVLDPQGNWIFQLAPGEPIQPAKIVRPPKIEKVQIPVGAIERTKFYIYKLEYCRGEEVIASLQRIADSLGYPGTVNQDLLLTIQSAQWLEGSDSIIFTGTEESLDKVRELMEEIDRPLRQVFIEMLILETDIEDSLRYGVSWGTRSGGGNTSTTQAFIGGASGLPGALDTTGVGSTPSAASLARTLGYHLGIIGQRITHNGTQFASLGLLIDAEHERACSNILLSPRIIAEDNKTAEIFVGVNTRFQTQAISNDLGSILTTNFEFRDVGTTLRVTPHICHNQLITLDIEQEVSSVQTGQESTSGNSIQDISPGPTTNISRTTTTVHVPDKHFVIISGMLDDRTDRVRDQFPCLGGIPIIGAAFSLKTNTDTKRNLMIFIRPQIIDTASEYNTVTKRQQNIWKQKNRMKRSWKYEVDEALDLMNINPSSGYICDECPTGCPS